MIITRLALFKLILCLSFCLGCESLEEKQKNDTLRISGQVLDLTIVKGWQNGTIDGETSDSIQKFYNHLNTKSPSDGLRFANNIHILVSSQIKINKNQLDSIAKLTFD